MLVVAAALIAAPVIGLAHDGVEHVMGTVSALTKGSITVKTTKNENVTVLLDASTTYSRNDVKAALADLKVGERVVVNAKDNAADKLVGISIRWGANSTAKDDHGEHTK